jgi:hypothetical protein
MYFDEMKIQYNYIEMGEFSPNYEECPNNDCHLFQKCWRIWFKYLYHFDIC